MHLVPLLPTDGGALHQCGSIKVLDRSPAPPSTPLGLSEKDRDRHKESEHISEPCVHANAGSEQNGIED